MERDEPTGSSRRASYTRGFTFEMTAAQHAQLAAIAKLRSISRAELLRRYIDDAAAEEAKGNGRKE